MAERVAHVSTDIHNLSHRLHPWQLEALGLVGAVRTVCLDLGAQGVNVHFVEARVPPMVPDPVALGVFRILQESLSNVVKHSGAASADVTLTGTNGAIVLRVADGGRGFLGGIDQVFRQGADDAVPAGVQLADPVLVLATGLDDAAGRGVDDGGDAAGLGIEGVAGFPCGHGDYLSAR